MSEFYIARVVLALLQLTLSVLVWRRRCGPLLLLAVCAWCDATGNLLPFHVHDIDWPRRVWLLARTPLLFSVSLDLFRFLYLRTFRIERRGLLLFGSLLGLGIVLSAWNWDITTTFSILTTIRQYLVLALAVGTTGVWVYVRWVRPVEPRQPRQCITTMATASLKRLPAVHKPFR